MHSLFPISNIINLVIFPLFMCQFVFGVLFGMFVFILLEPLILWFTLRKKDKPSIQSVKVTPTHLHTDLIKGAIPTCNNLNWFNVLFQRFFLEITPSYAYKERIKNGFYKKTAKIKTFCELEITDLDFGTEFPVFKKAKLVTKEEIVKILKNIKSRRKDDKKNKKKPDGWKLSDSEKELLNKTETESIFDELASNSIEHPDDELSYDNVMVLFELEYNGVYSIDCILKLPQNIELSVRFELHHLSGPILVRFPAIYNHTRIECSMLNIDRLDFKIESEIQNKYLKRTATSIINKYFTTLMKTNYIYPKFYSKVIPSMVPSMKIIDYTFDKSLDEKSIKGYTHNICLYMSMDYKVIKIKNGVIMRRGNYSVNKTNERLRMAEIQIKEFFECENKEIPVHILVEDSKWDEKGGDEERNEHDINTEFNITSDSPNQISGSSTEPNKEQNKKVKSLHRRKILDTEILKTFYELFIQDLVIFQETLHNFIEVKHVKEYKNHTKINIVFKGKEYGFNRIYADKAVIFQSDTSAEYFAFKVRSLQALEIYFYVKNPDFLITQTLMLAIKKKMELINLRSLRKNTFVKGVQNYDAVEIDRLKINKIIFGMNEWFTNKNRHNNCLGSLLYKDFRVYNDSNKILKHLRSDFRLRFKLLFDSFEIKSEPKNNDAILHYQVFFNNKSSVVHSYSNDTFIIDIIDEQKMIGFAIGDGEEAIRIFYIDEILSSAFHAFIFGIKVFNRIDDYLTTSIILEKTVVNSLKYEEKFIFQDCTSLCVEFEIRIDDEIYFSVYNSTTRKYTFDKIKILGKLNRLCRFIFPIQHGSTQIVTLKSKHDPLANQLNISKVFLFQDTLIDTTIEIAHKKKYKYYFSGIDQYSFYWDLEENEINAFCLSPEGLMNATNTGLMLTESGLYGVCLSNKTGKKRSINIKIGSLLIKG